MATLWSILQRLATERPQAPAIDDGAGRQLTRRELLESADDLARRLVALDVDTVALLADNGPCWAVADLAAQRAGTTLVPLPPFFSDEQLGHALVTAGPGVVLTDTPERVPATGAVSELSGLWCVPTGGTGRHPGVSRITFTSGSTGAPRGVLLTDAVLADVTRSLLDVTAMASDERHLALLPLAVLLENVAGLHRALAAGACCVLPPLGDIAPNGPGGADGEAIDRALATHAATSAVLVPGLLEPLVDFLEATARRSPACCRFLGVGGAPVAGHVLSRASSVGLPVFEGYGLSEAGSVLCLNARDARRMGSVGRPLPHVELQLAPDGEIVLLAPSFAGYVGAPIPAHRTPWPTGDLGFLDDEGYLHITGRKKAVFISSFGRNVSPEWVERRLLDERAVMQVAVFGEGLSAPVAVIVPAPAATPEQLEACVRAANAQLPDYARVGRWITAPVAFTVANGFWAATGGPRRAAIERDFSPLFSAPGEHRIPATLLPGHLRP